MECRCRDVRQYAFPNVKVTLFFCISTQKRLFCNIFCSLFVCIHKKPFAREWLFVYVAAICYLLFLPYFA